MVRYVWWTRRRTWREWSRRGAWCRSTRATNSSITACVTASWVWDASRSPRPSSRRIACSSARPPRRRRCSSTSSALWRCIRLARPPIKASVCNLHCMINTMLVPSLWATTTLTSSSDCLRPEAVGGAWSQSPELNMQQPVIWPYSCHRPLLRWWGIDCSLPPVCPTLNVPFFFHGRESWARERWPLSLLLLNRKQSGGREGERVSVTTRCNLGKVWMTLWHTVKMVHSEKEAGLADNAHNCICTPYCR